MKPTVALIINTAQQPEYLARVLRAVANQSEHPDELIVAEDGTDLDAAALAKAVAGLKQTCFHHVAQEKAGFRRSRILNVAIARAEADYVVFLDGDTVPHPDFVRDHRRLARRGFFVQGHRVLVNEKGSVRFGTGDFCRDRRAAFLRGELNGLKHVFRWLTPFKRVLKDLDGVRGCNLGVWRSDLVRVNGYDEGYLGWGCEDLDLATRLFHSGVLRLDVRGRALCYHLWHPPADRWNLPANERRLKEAVRNGATRCVPGLDRHWNENPQSAARRPEQQAKQQS